MEEESNEEGNNDEAKYDNSNEEEVPADDGESLVIQRARNTSMMTNPNRWSHNESHK